MNRDAKLVGLILKAALVGCLLVVVSKGLHALAETQDDDAVRAYPKTLPPHPQPLSPQRGEGSNRIGSKSTPPAAAASEELEEATFGAGCFWCSEAVFKQLKGVKTVVSGYTGGRVRFPTYAQVFSGFTGHAEVVQITFDPKVISYADLLEVFWQTHDPTTLNRQEMDVGTQYRSAVFYHTDEQKRLAEEYKQKLNASQAFDSPVVTEITPFAAFYPAETYHQNYYQRHSSQSYCKAVIRPKINKVKKVFHDKLKSSAAPAK